MNDEKLTNITILSHQEFWILNMELMLILAKLMGLHIFFIRKQIFFSQFS